MRIGVPGDAALVLLAFLAGIVVAERHFARFDGRDLNVEQPLGSAILQTMPDETVTVTFLDAQRWKVEAPVAAPGLRTLGFSRVGGQPCEVVLPAVNYSILALPAAGKAWWEQGSGAGDNIAHEILHCLRGGWHPPWPTAHPHF